MNKVLVVLLSHQKPNELERTIAQWKPFIQSHSLLLAYGGDQNFFPAIAFEPKVFVADPQLRLRDQQRQQQSWTGVLHAVRDYLQAQPDLDYVYLVEYDQIPLVPDLLDRMTNRLQSEGADAIVHHLHRIDGTSNPHYLYHSNDKRFHAYFAALSRRSDSQVILSMLGTGSFWNREAFDAIASHQEPFPIYVEVYLPTLAHHLGFRIRDLPDQNPFVTHLGNRGAEIEPARNRGAWSLHPVKTLPVTETAAL